MHLTTLFYIVIVLLAIVVILRKDARLYVYYLLIFFLPFTAAAVINFDSITYGLQPSYFLLLTLTVLLLTKKARFSSIRTSKAIIPLVVFLAICVVSIVLPFLFKGDIMVTTPEGRLQPLVFSRINITQILYIAFVIFSYMIFTHQLFISKQIFKNSVKIYIVSSVFVALWGFFQLILMTLKMHYPNFLFNNAIGFRQWYDFTLFGTINRVNSLAPEPSVLSHYILSVLPLTLYLLISKTKLFDRHNSLILLAASALLLIILIFTASTTAYVGLVFMLFLFLITSISFRNRAFSKKGLNLALFLLVTLIITVFLIFVFYSNSQAIVNAFKLLISEKASSESGQIRVDGVIKSLFILSKTYGLGIGWGSNRTVDLLSNIMAQVGIIGLLVFCLWVFVMFKKSIKVLKRLKTDKPNEYSLLKGIVLAFVSCLFASCIAVPDLIFLYFWFLAALLTASDTLSSSNNDTNPAIQQ